MESIYKLTCFRWLFWPRLQLSKDEYEERSHPNYFFFGAAGAAALRGAAAGLAAVTAAFSPTFLVKVKDAGDDRRTDLRALTLVIVVPGGAAYEG